MGFFSKSAPELNAEGLTALGRGNFEQAVALFDKACVKSPNEGTIWFNLGYAHVKRGNNQLAVVAFERSVNLGGPMVEQARQWLEAINNPPKSTFKWEKVIGTAIGAVVLGALGLG